MLQTSEIVCKITRRSTKILRLPLEPEHFSDNFSIFNFSNISCGNVVHVHDFYSEIIIYTIYFRIFHFLGLPKPPRTAPDLRSRLRNNATSYGIVETGVLIASSLRVKGLFYLFFPIAFELRTSLLCLPAKSFDGVTGGGRAYVSHQNLGEKLTPISRPP
jgi:hypothetical protein